MNSLSLFGLAMDIGGAILLIRGELQQNASMFHYWATGEQKDDYKKRWKSLTWWKRWPITVASKFGSRSHMGTEPLEHTLPVKLWGLALLIVGFLFQALGVAFP